MLKRGSWVHIALALAIAWAIQGCVVVGNPGPTESCVCSAVAIPEPPPPSGSLFGFIVVDVQGPVEDCTCS